MSKPMKKYSIEFKQQAVQLARQDDMTISQAARDLGVSQAGLNRWVNHSKQQEALGRPAFTGRGVIALSESEQEIKDLKREVETLRLEREICLDPKTHLLDHKTHLTGMVADGRGRLKAATKFFAKESR